MISPPYPLRQKSTPPQDTDTGKDMIPHYTTTLESLERSDEIRRNKKEIEKITEETMN